jgi:hypothetical protein
MAWEKAVYQLSLGMKEADKKPRDNRTGYFPYNQQDPLPPQTLSSLLIRLYRLVDTWNFLKPNIS